MGLFLRSWAPFGRLWTSSGAHESDWRLSENPRKVTLLAKSLKGGPTATVEKTRSPTWIFLLYLCATKEKNIKLMGKGHQTLLVLVKTH